MSDFSLDWFPTEILTTILLSVSSTSDLVNLAGTCSRLQHLYSARRLVFVAQAADAEFGPLQDAIQLVTHNSSQPAHVVRDVPLSFALLNEVIRVGRIARRWEEIYPFKKWKDNFERRRLLTDDEGFVLRQALYRLWLYSRAFHNPQYSRYNRLTPVVRGERAILLHNWTTGELAQMADVKQVMKDVVGFSICPSNGTIARKFHKRYPDTRYQLLFNVHLNYPPPAPYATPPPSQQYSIHNQHMVEKQYSKYKPTASHEPGAEGWGDDIVHYYVVEDMLKLDPEQILWLKDNAPSRSQVEAYTRGLGEWFENNGETFSQTLEFVLGARGVERSDFYSAISEEQLGVAVDEF